MTNRRALLRTIAGIWPASVLWSQQGVAQETTETAVAPARDYFKELGLKPFINAVGPYSTLGGSDVWPEVASAMNYALVRRAKMKELHDAVGKRIAELLGSESAMVPAGATSAITLGTAACITMGDSEKIRQLPDVTGLKHEVIIQKVHRYSYDGAIRVAGGKLIEVETTDDIRDAVNDNTAMMHFLMNEAHVGIPKEEFIALGKELGVPTLCDAATTIPPYGRLAESVAMGFDLLCFSGGKGLRGPYSAGLLLGRKDLIAAARLNNSPNNGTVGRGMKVAKEELLGAMVAVEISLSSDYETALARNHERVEAIADLVAGLPSVTTSKHMAKGDDSDPYLQIDWDEDVIRISRAELKEQLRTSDPSIEISSLRLSAGRIHLSTAMMQPGDVEVVGSRIRKLLLQHS